MQVSQTDNKGKYQVIALMVVTLIVLAVLGYFVVVHLYNRAAEKSDRQWEVLYGNKQRD